MNETRIGRLDTLSNLCYDYSFKIKNDKELYKYYITVLHKPDFLNPTEITMLQLKNAGGMSLIKKKEVPPL